MTDLSNWLVVFVRVSTMVAVFPVLSAPVFPFRLRAALAAIMTTLIFPTVPPVPIAGMSLLSLVGLFTTEVFVGLLFGFVARMVFYALEIGGAIMSTEMGLSMAPSFNPLSSMRTEAPTLILYYLAAMLFLSLDLHHWLLAGFGRTYELLPVGASHLRPELLADVLARSNRVFITAVQMAAPLLATSFVISLVFALLGRAVPQMNVFSESFAIRTISGLAVFGLTLNLMAQHLLNFLRRLPDDVLQIAYLLAAR